MDVSPEQIQLGRFWMKYLRLTRAGVGTLRAFEVIIDEEKSPDFKGVIASLHTELEAGFLLSEALAKFPDRFSLSVSELIKTAEKEGHWDLVIQELAEGMLDGTFD